MTSYFICDLLGVQKTTKGPKDVRDRLPIQSSSDPVDRRTRKTCPFLVSCKPVPLLVPVASRRGSVDKLFMTSNVSQFLLFVRLIRWAN